MGNNQAILTQNQQKLSICLLGKLPYVPSGRLSQRPEQQREFLTVVKGFVTPLDEEHQPPLTEPAWWTPVSVTVRGPSAAV